MNPTMLRFLIVVAALVARANGAEPLEIAIHERSGRLDIRHAGNSLLVYSFASNQFKPYVKELRTSGGENLLLDAPADHLHHHGLMYAIRINGTNFWEELADSGRQKHIRFLDHRAGGTNANFTELVRWVAPQSDEALLMEERALALTVDTGNGEVALRWRSTFTVGRHKLTLHGSGYNGLGLRFPEHWNGVAQHRNSAGLPYSAGHTWDITPAKWAAVSHPGGRKAVTLVLLGNPANPGETRFFSMNNPFTYLSVTQNLEQKPLEYAAGERFQLSYLLLLWEGQRRSEELNQRYEEWFKSTAAR
jgi:hypothetical protein